MSVTAFEAYQQQIGRLVELAKELLSEPEQDSLRMAIAANRSKGTSSADAVPGMLPRGINIGERLIAQPEAADAELSADEIRQLERQVEESLPNL